MLACLATIEPLDTATGTRTTIRVSSVNDRVNGALVNGLNGQVWEPALVEAPVLGLTLWNGDFTAAVSPAGATLPLKMQVVKGTYPTADALAWIGAPVSIYAEAPGVAWPWTKRFAGRVRSFGRRGQTLALTAEVDLEPLSNNILTAVYAGTGGAEGGADLKNRVKPLAIGWVKNEEPVLVDVTNSVYQFSAYGVIEAVTTLFERGSDFGASQGDYATYAALVAATIPAGKWGTCLAAGMIRLGAPAFGVITGDIKGHRVGATTPRLTGAIVNALATIAGVNSADIDTATLTALDAAVPYSANLLLTEQTTFFDQARTMALACNYQAGASLIGKFFVAKVSLTGTVVLELEAAGKRSPQVFQSDEADVSVPYWRTVLGANRAWRVHSADEIAFAAELVEKGLYDAAVTYREGNIVNLANGSRWLYTFATATSGNAPPTWPTASNTWWTNVAPPTSASWSLVVNDNGARPSNYAGTTNSLIAHTSGAGAGTRSGNTLTKTAGGGAFNTAWSTAEVTTGNGIVSCKPYGQDIMFGLVKLAEVGAAQDGLGLYVGNTNNIYFSEDGAISASIGTYTAGDTLSFEYNGGTLLAFKNGVLITSYTPNVSYATAQLRAQAFLYNVGSEVLDFVFLPSTASNFATIVGATKPADNATVNIVTRSASAPGSPVNGDVWVDTSVTPNITKVRVAGAWQAGANYTTEGSHIGVENAASIDANIVADSPIIVFATSAGAPKTGELDKIVLGKLFRLGAALTSGITWTKSLISGNATSTISGTGTATLTITGPNNSTLAVESVIRLTAEYLGIPRTADVKVIRQDDPPTSSGGGSGNPGTSASTTSLGNTTGTTFPGVASATLTCKAGTAGQVACTFPGSYKRNTTSVVGSTTGTGKWQWRVVGGAWADIDAGDTGNAAESINEPPFINSAGTGAFDATKTALTSGTDYEFQFIWHRTTVTGSGTIEVYRSAGALVAAGS